MYNCDTKWGTYDGKFVKVRDMEDAHVANLIKHLHIYKYNGRMLRLMLEEASLRGLTVDFLDRAHIPFKDKEGNWMLWSHEEHKPVKVG